MQLHVDSCTYVRNSQWDFEEIKCKYVYFAEGFLSMVG